MSEFDPYDKLSVYRYIIDSNETVTKRIDYDYGVYVEFYSDDTSSVGWDADKIDNIKAELQTDEEWWLDISE